MTPLMLRQLWSLVEATQATILLSLDDGNLVQSLLRQLRQEQPLNHQEVDLVQNYLQSRIALIRDMAQERLVAG